MAATISKSVYEHILRWARQGDGQYQGGQYVIDCPNPCHLDPRSLYVEPRRHLYICFSCGLRGGFRDLVMEDPARYLPVRRLCDGETGRTKKSLSTWGSQNLVRITDPHPLIASDFRQRAYQYLLDRHMTPSQIEDYQVSLRPMDNRVWFPWWDHEGTVTYLMGRALDGQLPKTIEEYLHHEQAKPLFGLHVHVPSSVIVLVEGWADHVVTPDSYALMGSQVTAGQVLQLQHLVKLGYANRVFVLLDSDAKGKLLRNVNVMRASGVPAVGCYLEGVDADPNELGPDVMLCVVRQLRSFSAKSLRATRFLSVHVPAAVLDKPSPLTSESVEPRYE